jgi:hypothetical protein
MKLPLGRSYMLPGCAHCGKVGAAAACNGCHAVKYCAAACQVEHWQSAHKAACRELALQTYRSMGPSRLPETAEGLDKVIAVTWTLRKTISPAAHIIALGIRAQLEIESEDGANEVRRRLARLATRALTELPWPTLPNCEQDWHSYFLLAWFTHKLGGLEEAMMAILKIQLENIERGWGRGGPSGGRWCGTVPCWSGPSWGRSGRPPGRWS